jgi:two-component system, NarL family, nitrate/nitrite sensor histidine kinase NarX
MTRRRQLRIVHNGERPLDQVAPARVAPGAGALHDNPTLGATLQRGLRAIVALSGARAGAIRLVSPERRGMRLVTSVGLPPSMVLKERVVALDCGICGVALQGDGAQLDPLPQACSRRMGAAAGGDGCGPVLAVPLHCGGEPIGVFNLFFGDSSRVPEDVGELMAPVAQMLDVILENASLEDARMRASLAAERQMLAGEVHDSLAQGLAYMRMRMPLMHDAIRTGERQHALKYYQDVNDAMGEAHGRLRELITQFRHVVGQGLLQALEGTARTFEDRTGVRLTIDNRAGGMSLPADQEAQVYQIVQEALANVVKHAGARDARIVIERTSRSLKVSVEDDGRGGARRVRIGADCGEHYGLDIMRERAQRIGATLEIRSVAGRGTRVRLVVPLRARIAEAECP